MLPQPDHLGIRFVTTGPGIGVFCVGALAAYRLARGDTLTDQERFGGRPTGLPWSDLHVTRDDGQCVPRCPCRLGHS